MTLDTESLLTAIALVRTRLGQPGEPENATFKLLFGDLEPRAQFSVVEALCALTAMLIESLDELFEAITDQPLDCPVPPEELAQEVLDALVGMILNEAVRGR